MSGEGTGGGGALVMLLALWIAATALIVGQDPFGSDALTAGGPTQAGEGMILEPTPRPTPAVQLPECEADSCDQVVTRGELALAFTLAFQLPPTTVDFFADDADSPQESAINRLAAAGIASGCDDDRFCPERRITRGHLATFLHRALDLPPADRDYFTDDSDLVHEHAINRLAAAGIASGCAQDRYCPDGTVSLRQLITMLERASALEAEPVA